MEMPNTDYIDSVAGGDDAFRTKFIAILKTEYPDEIAHYKKVQSAQDFTSTASIVHKLKHKLNVCGMQEAYGLAVKYEEELKVQRDRHHAEFVKILDQVDEFIKSL